MDLVFTVLGGIFTLTVVLGVVKMSRVIILTGLFCYSILPIIGETMGYMADKAPYHVLFIALFLIQLVMSSLRFDTIDDTTVQFSKIAYRIIACFIMINAISAIMVLSVLSTVPMIYGVYHVVIACALVPPLIKRIGMAQG